MKYRFTIVLIVSFTSLCAFVLVIFFSSIGFNPVQSEVSHQRLIKTFIPQGWAFFTRSPREAQSILYSVVGETLIPVKHKHSGFSKAFGLNRKSTAIVTEASLLRANIPDSVFMNTQWGYQADRIGEFPKTSFKVTNEMGQAILCGEYVLVFQKPVPWAWSKSMEEMDMPAKVARLEIVCDE